MFSRQTTSETSNRRSHCTQHTNNVSSLLYTSLHHSTLVTTPMVIDAKTIVLTLAIVAVAGYFGLQFIRRFALSIAQENHDANLAMDMSVEAKRAKRERDADAAASAAFAKVEPFLPNSVVSKGMSPSQAQVPVAKPPSALSGGLHVQPSAPSSGGLQIIKNETVDAMNDEEDPFVQEGDVVKDEER
eukprot:scaffold1627_cov164-Alexandrium_tamarense.AAC.18